MGMKALSGFYKIRGLTVHALYLGNDKCLSRECFTRAAHFHCTLVFAAGRVILKRDLVISNPGETRNWQKCSCCDRRCCCWYGQSERTSHQRCRADCSEDNHDCHTHPTCSRTGMHVASQNELCMQRSHGKPVLQSFWGRPEPNVVWVSRTLWATDGLRYPGCSREKLPDIPGPCLAGKHTGVSHQRVSTGGQRRNSKYQSGPGSRQAKRGPKSQPNKEVCAFISLVLDRSIQSSVAEPGTETTTAGQTLPFSKPPQETFAFTYLKCDMWFMAEKCYKSRIISHLLFE